MKVWSRGRCQKGGGTPLFRQAENIYAIDRNNEPRFVVRGGCAIWGVLYSGGLMLDPKLRVRWRPAPFAPNEVLIDRQWTLGDLACGKTLL